MTPKQFRKLELRIRSLLRQNGLVNIILWEDIDETIHLQVVGGKTETIGLDPNETQNWKN
jgi:hypothetical protein